jgi:hypothetical protein
VPKTRCAYRLIAQCLIACLSWPFAMGLALADLRSPPWFITSARKASLWHYRVPIIVPAGAKLDGSSPRIVRSSGARFEGNLPMAH